MRTHDDIAKKISEILTEHIDRLDGGWLYVTVLLKTWAIEICEEVDAELPPELDIPPRLDGLMGESIISKT